MSERTFMDSNKIIFGDLEFTTTVKRLISAYRFRNNGKDPEAVVIPIITKVAGVAVEYQPSEYKDPEPKVEETNDSQPG